MKTIALLCITLLAHTLNAQITWIPATTPSGIMAILEVRADGALLTLNQNNPIQPNISLDQGMTWTPGTGAGLPNGSMATNVKLGATPTGTLLVSALDGTQKVWRSTDGGNTFTLLNALNGLPTVSYSISGFAHGPAGVVYAYGDRFLRSDDDGLNWIQTSVQNFSDVTVTSTHVFGMFGTIMKRSDLSGVTWTTLNFPTVNVGTGYDITTGANDRIFMVGNANKVITSIDSGVTWTAVQSGLTASFISRIAASPIADQWVCGRPNDVFYTVYPSSWTSAMTGLSFSGTNQLQGFRAAPNGSLYCWGQQALWRADISTFTSELERSAPFTLFPNPAEDHVTLRGPETLSGTTRVRILDLTGRVVRDARINELPARINVQDLAPGNYSFELWEQGSRTGVQHLMVQ